MQNTINILVSTDTNFMPILGVMLHSLVTSRKKNYLLAVYMLHNSDELDKQMLEQLQEQVRSYDDFDLIPVDVSGFPEISALHLGQGYVPAAYYRLLAPVLLSHLDKVLYLDCDLVVKSDIIELYDTDLGDNIIAACKDVAVIGQVSTPVDNLREYLLGLGITNMHNYFNTGVLLMNLEKMRNEQLPVQMIKYAQTYECLLVDQDVLNYFCQGRVKFLDKAWNSHQKAKSVVYSRYALNTEWKSFIKGCANEKIVHFTIDKPWNDADIAGADIWWSYARQTQWHECLLQRLVQWQSRSRSVRDEVNEAFNSIYSAGWLHCNLLKLMKWNEAHIYAELVDLAIEREDMHEIDERNLERLKSSEVVFYGAGYWCRSILNFYDILELPYPAEIWDRNALNSSPRLCGVPVCLPAFKSLGKNTLIAITAQLNDINNEILAKHQNMLTYNELMGALALALWLKRAEYEESLAAD